jgi:hypothetical protein
MTSRITIVPASNGRQYSATNKGYAEGGSNQLVLGGTGGDVCSEGQVVHFVGRDR